jgi:TolA-binding protein
MVPSARAVVAIAALWLAVAAARADTVVTAAGRFEGTIKRIDGKGVSISIGAGETVIDLKQVVQVDLPRPAGMDQGAGLLAEGSYFQAAAIFQPIVERFATVRVPGVTWTGEAILRLGDAYLGLKKYPEAERMYDGYSRLYGATKALEIKRASVQVAQGNCTAALQTLDGILEPMLKGEWVPEVDQAALVEGLMMRGQCLAAESKPREALDSYLLVVTIFGNDTQHNLEAKLKVGEMFVRLDNRARAAEYFGEIIKAAPDSAYAADARKQLAALEK